MGVDLSWKVIGASVVGTSHIASGKQCEDSCWAQVIPCANGLDMLQMIVTDGAGSASHGGDGAEYAILGAVEYLDKKIQEPEFVLNDTFATECLLAVREELFYQAENLGIKPRELACTFLGIFSCGHETLLMQIGDGGIVVDVGNGLEAPITPMNGEYVNTTHFVTDEDAIKLLVTKRLSSPVFRAAAFSDGLQRLLLNLAENTPHEPPFLQFFSQLEKTTVTEELLHLGLVKFLSGDSVNSRTDDDKTLTLAIHNSIP